MNSESSRMMFRIVFILLLTAALIAFVELVKFPKHVAFWSEVQNTGHIPLFGCFAILVLRYAIKPSRLFMDKALFQYITALIIALGVGLLVEVIQYFGARDADIYDVARDMIGAVAFCLIYIAFDRDSHSKFAWWRNAYSYLSTVIAIVVLAIYMTPLASLGYAYIERNSNFPVICDFDSPSIMAFIRPQKARLDIIETPAEFPLKDKRSIGKLSLFPSAYPGIVIKEPVGDWTGYQSLLITIYSENPEPIKLSIRIDDIYYNNTYNDRFNRRVEIVKGINEIRIPLDDIRYAPMMREMDMSNISLIILFSPDLAESTTIYLSQIHLE